MKHWGLLVAAAIVILTNAIALVAVARNRAGKPVETIELTQRELPAGFHLKEDTGISLRLSWNGSSFNGNSYAWLDRPKLEALGFDMAAAVRNKALPRPAFVVFEYNGPAWEEWRRNYKGHLASAQSRLIPIDADKSPASLLQKYPDRQKYLIVPCVIRAFANPNDDGYGPPPERFFAAVSEILPQNIHVPPPARGFAGPSYSVTLAYGHRFEPWVVTQP